MPLPEKSRRNAICDIWQGKAPSQGTSAIHVCNLVIDLQVETSEVHISDFDYDTISWMLRYMYGCLELSPQNLSHAKVTLASAADICAAAAAVTAEADATVAAMLWPHVQVLLLLLLLLLQKLLLLLLLLLP